MIPLLATTDLYLCEFCHTPVTLPLGQSSFIRRHNEIGNAVGLPPIEIACSNCIEQLP